MQGGAYVTSKHSQCSKQTPHTLKAYASLMCHWHLRPAYDKEMDSMGRTIDLSVSLASPITLASSCCNAL